MKNRYDVCVIGAGAVGCAVAMELSKYELSVCVIEKEEDVCSGTSKANSGIVHAGYDAVPGTMKAKMNLRGAELIRKLSVTLDFPYRENGSLVICLEGGNMSALRELYDRGKANGVRELSLISGGEARRLEPGISEKTAAALYAPTAGIVCPFGMTIAFAETAAASGAEFAFLTRVCGIIRKDGGYRVLTDRGDVDARYVVNAAGVYSDMIHNMVSKNRIHLTARRGEYMLLDREAGGLVDKTVFGLPDSYGKGVLVAPTTHGNILVGPSADDVPDREDTSTTAAVTGSVRERAVRNVPGIPFGKVITGFSGLRAHADGDDFIIGEPDDAEGFFDAAGIESPGLTGAPAIGEYIAEMIAERSRAVLRENAVSERRRIPELSKLPPEERAALIAENPAYGNIICRCEGISEGEITDAIRRNPGARSLDGIKRRVRQGMGRCQAGFCTPGAMAILSRELGIPVSCVTKNVPGSEIIGGCGK